MNLSFINITISHMQLENPFMHSCFNYCNAKQTCKYCVLGSRNNFIKTCKQIYKKIK